MNIRELHIGPLARIKFAYYMFIYTYIFCFAFFVRAIKPVYILRLFQIFMYLSMYIIYSILVYTRQCIRLPWGYCTLFIFDAFFSRDNLF